VLSEQPDDKLDRTLTRLEGDLRDLRKAVIQLWGSTIVGFLVVIATVIATST
jgi:hypothetical protein